MTSEAKPSAFQISESLIKKTDDNNNNNNNSGNHNMAHDPTATTIYDSDDGSDDFDHILAFDADSDRDEKAPSDAQPTTARHKGLGHGRNYRCGTASHPKLKGKNSNEDLSASAISSTSSASLADSNHALSLSQDFDFEYLHPIDWAVPDSPLLKSGVLVVEDASDAASCASSSPSVSDDEHEAPPIEKSSVNSTLHGKAPENHVPETTAELTLNSLTENSTLEGTTATEETSAVESDRDDEAGDDDEALEFAVTNHPFLPGFFTLFNHYGQFIPLFEPFHHEAKGEDNYDETNNETSSDILNATIQSRSSTTQHEQAIKQLFSASSGSSCTSSHRKRVLQSVLVWLVLPTLAVVYGVVFHITPSMNIDLGSGKTYQSSYIFRQSGVKVNHSQRSSVILMPPVPPKMESACNETSTVPPSNVPKAGSKQETQYYVPPPRRRLQKHPKKTSSNKQERAELKKAFESSLQVTETTKTQNALLFIPSSPVVAMIAPKKASKSMISCNGNQDISSDSENPTKQPDYPKRSPPKKVPLTLLGYDPLRLISIGSSSIRPLLIGTSTKSTTSNPPPSKPAPPSPTNLSFPAEIVLLISSTPSFSHYQSSSSSNSFSESSSATIPSFLSTLSSSNALLDLSYLPKSLTLFNLYRFTQELFGPLYEGLKTLYTKWQVKGQLLKERIKDVKIEVLNRHRRQILNAVQSNVVYGKQVSKELMVKVAETSLMVQDTVTSFAESSWASTNELRTKLTQSVTKLKEELEKDDGDFQVVLRRVAEEGAKRVERGGEIIKGLQSAVQKFTNDNLRHWADFVRL
jgi:hypothetical protein